MLGGLAVGLGPNLLQEGLVEGPVVHLLGEVVDARPSMSCLGDDAVEERSPRRIVAVGVDVVEAPLEEGEHRPHLLVHPPLRPSDAVQGLLELQRGFETVDPVVLQRAPQLIEERLREPPTDVAQVPQVGEQVLRRRAPPEVGVIVGGGAPEQRRHVDERVQDLVLPAAPLLRAERRIPTRTADPVRGWRKEVEAEEHAAELVELARAAVMVEDRGSASLDELREVGTGSGRGGFRPLDRFEHEEGSPGTDLLVRPGHDLSYPAIHLGANDGLHLHRFEHDQRITSGDDVAGLH